MKSFLSSPEHNNEDERIRAWTIQNISSGLILLSLLALVVIFVIAHGVTLRTVSLLGFIILSSAGIIVLTERKKTDLAEKLLILTLWLVITLGGFASGGIAAPILIGYIIVIWASGLISKDHRTAYITALLCLITISTIAYAETIGMLPGVIQYPPIVRASIYSLFLLTAVLLHYITTRNNQSLISQTQASEMRYRSLLESIPITTYINGLSTGDPMEYVSPQVEEFLGYSSQDFVSDPFLWAKILHPDDVRKVLAESQRTSQTYEPFEMEYRLIAKDQSVVWVKDEANLVRDNKGKPLYWLGVWTDITSQKHAESEQADLVQVMTKRTMQLQTAAEVSRAASSILDLNKLLPNVVDLIRNHFDYYYVGIFLVDETKEWAALSAATGDMGKKMLQAGHRLKVEESSMIGWCIRHREARIALDVGEDAVRFINPLLPLTRSEIALPLNTHGETIGSMTIQSDRPAAFSRVDITALQTMADQIANAIANARLFTERAGLIQELESQNAELERFTYTVSHDLRSPLVTMRGFLGYLRQDAITGDLERFDSDLNRIANAVDKMQKLLNELLELSRVGRIANPPENVPFEDMVKDVAETLAGPLEASHVKLEVSGEFPIVCVDRLRLTEVIQNLVNNAIKFMGNQSQPVIRIGMSGNDLDGKPIFYVQDNGIGIEPQYHERIFGLFNRLDPSIEGTGIGLTLVKRIIETHNGRIWVESEPGKGSTFFFTLSNEDVK